MNALILKVEKTMLLLPALLGFTMFQRLVLLFCCCLSATKR